MEPLRAGGSAGRLGGPAPVPGAHVGEQATLARVGLDARFERVRGRRLISVVAGPGFGKTTLMRGWAGSRRSAWCESAPGMAMPGLLEAMLGAFEPAIPDLPADDGQLAILTAAPGADAATVEAIAAYLGRRLASGLRQDLWLFVDDVHELEADEAATWLLGGLVRHAPPALHLVLGSRRDLAFPTERLRAQGDVADFGASELAFTVEELGSLLAAADGADPDLAIELHRVTAGWPAAVRLAIEALGHPGADAGAGEIIADLRRPGGPLFAYLAREVFEREPEPVQRLISTMALLDQAEPGLLDHLGIDDAGAVLAALAARGLFLQRQGDAYQLHDLVRDFARSAWPVPVAERVSVLRAAAEWHRSRRDAGIALGFLVAAEDWPAVAALVVEAGPALVRAGSGRHLTAVADLLPAETVDPTVAQVVGEAHASLGQSDQALAWLERATVAGQPLAADLAWRKAMSYYLRSELEQVLEVLDSTDLAGARLADTAALLGWAASAARRLGDGERASELAEQSLAAASAAGDDRALAVAETAAGLAADLRGDVIAAREHTGRALAAAERAGDLLQTVRIRINRASDLIEAGSYVAALRELDPANEIAELAGFTTLQALILMNRGLAEWARGQLEAASAAYEASMALYRRSGSRELAYAVIGRGDVYRDRGDLELARAAYEEGLTLAERSGDRSAVVPALYQYAKVLNVDNPGRASELADRAVDYGWPDLAWALNAKGWIAWFRGDLEVARACAVDAARLAREASDRYGIAESLELRTMAAPNPAAERRGLEEALAIWEGIGNAHRAETVRLAIARLSPGPAARAAADAAEARLEALGVRVSPVGQAGLLSAVAARSRDAIEVRTLGGFAVVRGGMLVSVEEWHSRKARDLLKILLTRRGRPVPRGRLMEALWPDDEPDLLSNRLSVAISMLRLLLDPAKEHAADRFVATDKDSVTLDLDAVAVDVEAFLAHAAAGADLERRGRHEEARARLAAAEAIYSGDFLEENPYDDWAVSMREEARATYLAVTRSLARLALAAGDHDSEIRYRLRLLERDPYDEAGHLALVAAHSRARAVGQARHAYRRYVARMAEIDVEAAPFPVEGPG